MPCQSNQAMVGLQHKKKQDGDRRQLPCILWYPLSSALLVGADPPRSSREWSAEGASAPPVAAARAAQVLLSCIVATTQLHSLSSLPSARNTQTLGPAKWLRVPKPALQMSLLTRSKADRLNSWGKNLGYSHLWTFMRIF